MASSAVTSTVYSGGERDGIIVICVAGLLSISAILILLLTTATLRTQYRYTHAIAYFASLLVSNTFQAIGTVMNFKWVSQGAVTPGEFCGAQGAIKHAGNVGTAIWSFLIAIHLFNLLFLRYEETKIGLAATLVLGWALIVMVVLAGPAAIQNAQIGPYFGVSGFWCWITPDYRRSRFYLEYFLEFLSAGLGFLLYAVILLRVRGNLYSHDGRWRLRFLARGEGWKLCIGRDIIDSSMIRVAARMVWYPIAYSLLILPIALSRLIAFNGHHVPSWATLFTDVVFNLTGFVNVILFIGTRRLIPDTNALPSFTMPRREINPRSSGITPFTLTRSTIDEEKASSTPSDPEATSHRQSIESINSITPLNRVRAPL